MTIANVKNKDILLDTNIIISCGDKSFGTEARNILKKLVDNKNSLAISEITPFEILRKDLENNFRRKNNKKKTRRLGTK